MLFLFNLRVSGLFCSAGLLCSVDFSFVASLDAISCIKNSSPGVSEENQNLLISQILKSLIILLKSNSFLFNLRVGLVSEAILAVVVRRQGRLFSGPFVSNNDY